MIKKMKKTEMIKTIAKIDGMACSMCEAHVNDAIRRAFDSGVKKVRSSHRKGSAEMTSIEPIDRDTLADALDAIGYKLIDLTEKEK